ncbi:MAG: glycosyltransferase family 2 protein [Selenomonadaceae bacterium]|nr:glycosyltransferase family 2 protein [Selenomonadaceae bacterium]
MRIVALTMIANEQEIVESFLRYNSNFIDEFVFVSSCCVDNTLIILRHLLQEGYKLRIYEEKEIDFNQKYLSNKYLKTIAKENDSDWIIPLDCDEFLTGNKNPREIIERLSTQNIYAVKWKNYAMTKNDDREEHFIPKRCQYAKKNYDGDNFTKVIVPTRAVLDKQIFISTGYHDAMGNGIDTVNLNEVWLAHFPTVSPEQYLYRLYERSIKSIIWRNYGFNEGTHIRHQIAQLEAGADVFDLAYGYVNESKKFDMYLKPLDLSYCDKETLNIKYAALTHTDVMQGIIKIGQLMAIKAYIADIKTEENPQRDNVLLYGVGYCAEQILNGLPSDAINIRAYIDGDVEKQFRMYNRKLIIPPDYIRFFQFDYIVITSQKHFSAMKKTLLELGVDAQKICTPMRLIRVMEEINKDE